MVADEPGGSGHQRASVRRLMQLPVRELLRSPGQRRAVTVDIEADALDAHDPSIDGPITVDLVAESGIDQISVEGTVTVPWRAACRRCLTELHGRTVIEVAEVHQDADGRQPLVDDAFPIEHDLLDLRPAIREYVLLELPPDPTCRDDCAGICPVCGADRNTSPCDCDASVRDERWAALDELRLDD